MKKLFTSLTLTAAAFMAMNAQQLQNAGFESDWGNMACWSAGSYANNGTAPALWKISNVGSPSAAKKVVGEKAAGYQSDAAIKITNSSTLGKVIPGYFSLGQPWSTAKGITGSNPDGGVFGGIDFTYRPDAVSFMYQSTGSGQPTVVAYSWKGTYTQKDVPSNIVVSGNCTVKDFTDRDRNILGMSTNQGGAVSSTDGAALISIVNTRLTATASSWTEAVLPFEYKTADTPEKFNIIFAAEDYFATSPANNNSLTVDDVKLLYYSRLKSLSINGAAVAGFDSKTYTYDLLSQELPDASAISYEVLSYSGDVNETVSVDKEKSQIIITVRHDNSDCTDYDGASTHTYTLQFSTSSAAEPQIVGTKDYTGIVTILANDDLGMAANLDRDGKVTITYYDNNTCTFLLPDFALGDSEAEYIGNIEVKNVSTSESDGTTTYNGVQKHMQLQLAGSEIVANVEVEGTTTSAGEAHMTIHVIWLPDPENDPEGEYGIPIEVEFNTATSQETNSKTFEGTVTILANDDLGMIENLDRAGKVTITYFDNNTCTFLLPDFALGDSEAEYIGNIEVKNVSTSEAAGTVTYSGVQKHMQLQLAGSEIVANVEVEGTSDDKGEAHMKIHVIWLPDPENDPDGENGIPIEVEFNGKDNKLSAIGTITVDNSSAEVEYYNIQGMRVNPENLTPGLYIRRQGTETRKIYLK